MSMRFVIDLGTIALSAGAGELSRIPVMKRGTWVKRIGGKKVRLAFTDASVSEVVKNFRSLGIDVVLDFEHASMNPEIAMGDAVPAAGWLKQLDDAADTDGILWGGVEFTARTRELIAKQEIRYVSPELDPAALSKATGEPQGLTLRAIALTNRPFLDMPSIALSDAVEEIGGGDAGGEREEKRLKITSIALTDERKVRVRFEDGSDAVSEEAIVPASPEVLRLSDVGRDDKGRLAFSSLDRKVKAGVLIDGAVYLAQQAQTALDDAIAGGKVLPAQRGFFEQIALSDLPAFREFLKGAPRVLDTSEKGTGDAGAVALTDLQRVDGEINGLVAKEQAASAGLSWPDGFKRVMSARPDLQRRRKELMR